jgi:uncharacterized protein with HEPN domain
MIAEPWRLADYLDHIIEAIDRIQRYTSGTAADAFLENEMVQDAVIRNLQIIGEASRNISRRYPEFADAHPGLTLRQAYAMRNQLTHGYATIDAQIVWDTIVGDLPSLKTKAQAARRTVPDAD